MNITEEQKQSLLEIWESDKGTARHWGTYYPERSKLERNLKTLLEYEVQEELFYYQGGKEKAEEVLAEYRSNFDWDTQYSLKIGWEVEPQIATQSLKLSVEEIKEYLNGDKEPECPSYSEVLEYSEGGSDLTGHYSKNVNANIMNLRLKQK